MLSHWAGKMKVLMQWHFQSGDSSQISTILSPLLARATHVYSNISLGHSDSTPYSESLRIEKGTAKDGLIELLQKHGGRPARPFLNDLRAIKSDAEISNMKKAGQASGQAFTHAMKRQFMTETELETFWSIGSNQMDAKAQHTYLSSRVVRYVGKSIQYHTRFWKAEF